MKFPLLTFLTFISLTTISFANPLPSLPGASLPSTLTAFQARDLARKEMNEEAKNKVIEIFGVQSPASVDPTEWQVLFYDPYAKQDGRVVKIMGYRILSIEDGYMQLERVRLAAYKQEEVIDPKNMKVDSDQILSILKRSTPIANMKVASLQMVLKKLGKGNVPPVWIVHVFSVKPSTGKLKEVGEARISADSGQILEFDIDPKKIQ
jgi:hypothetical protein